MAKKKNNYNMSVVDLSHYNIPHIKEDDRKDWVEFGLDNLYPQYLIELFTGSGINSAIVKGVSSMIAGDQQDTCQGLDVVDKDELEGDQREQYLKFSKLLKNGSRNTIKTSGLPSTELFCKKLLVGINSCSPSIAAPERSVIPK